VLSERERGGASEALIGVFETLIKQLARSRSFGHHRGLLVDRTVFRRTRLRPSIETRTLTRTVVLRPAKAAASAGRGSASRTVTRPGLRSVRLTPRIRAVAPAAGAVAVNRARHAAWQTSCTWTLPPRACWRAVAISRAVGAGL
jgi:hypothetical protein